MVQTGYMGGVLDRAHGWHLLYFRSRQVAISRALAFQYVGLREQTDGRWLVSFMNLDLGTITNNTLSPL
jgi:hypothetical protein